MQHSFSPTTVSLKMASTASSDAILEPFVEIFSPVPPMQTGPADYLDKVLERVCAVPGCAARIKIAIDPDLIPAGARPPRSIHGARVEDYRSFSRNVPTGRSRIFFLANNNHHAYVYSTLERQSSMAEGRVISVIHDVSAFMLHRYRLENGNHQLSEADVVAAAYPQYGSATSRYVRARQDGIMPDIFEYVTHSQYAALANSHEIWVHSLFAIAKLTCESDIPARQLPTIRLCAPPRLDELPFDKPAPVANRFFIGCFGWITPAKRIESCVERAFSGIRQAADRGEAPDPAYDCGAETTRRLIRSARDSHGLRCFGRCPDDRVSRQRRVPISASVLPAYLQSEIPIMR